MGERKKVRYCGMDYTVLDTHTYSGAMLIAPIINGRAQEDRSIVVDMQDAEGYETECVCCREVFPVEDMVLSEDGYICGDCKEEDYG